MRKFYKFSKDQAMKVINFKKKVINKLTKEKKKSYNNAKICYICKEKSENKYVKEKKYHK